VIKEGIGTKGPTLSTYISIPGRYLVLMPALGRVGVSRKIEDDDERRKLRDTMLELNPPKGLGFIVRTAGPTAQEGTLPRPGLPAAAVEGHRAADLKKNAAPVDIYEESDMIIRTIRDIFTSDVDAIYVDEPRPTNAPRSSCNWSCRATSPAALVRRQGAAVPQVQAGNRNQPHPQARSAAAPRRLDRHRPDRSPGGHRRQQRQLPHRRHGRGTAYQLNLPPPAKSPGNCGCATWAA
jgi:hypothetical protein